MKKVKINVLAILLISLLFLIFCNNCCNASMESNTEYGEIPSSLKGASNSYDTTLSPNQRAIRIQTWLGSILVIVQLLGIFISVLLIFVSIFKYLEHRKDDNSKNYKMIMIICINIAIVLFAASGILGIIRTFADKPIIYIYQEHETEVSVTLGNEKLIDCSYPKYDNGWRVLAKPNGDLIDLKTGKNLYALYWEGGNFEKSDFKEGFIVNGEDSAKFLEEKLEILGLNYKEAEEFIVYWLPKMEKNKYNYIKFVNQEEIERTMPLEISPKPDTVIRVYMQFKGLPFRIKVKEQELEKVERNGFTVVEWGGSEV